MGKIILIIVVLGIAYAWHQGLLDQYLSDPATARYKPADRYGDAAGTPQERCAAARTKLAETEAWARSKRGVVDENAQQPALDEARRAVQEHCSQ
jgi:hypothetical protein